MIESGATHRPAFSHQIHHTDRGSAARGSTFYTPHGPVSLPGFMPVGTSATVKGLTVEQLRSAGAQMLLANTYHLALRPGEDVIRDQGGLHTFMGWNGPILTDSGGFQVFSLAERVVVDDTGAHFQSHIDGSACTLTPESAVRIQEALGSDVAMVLDHVVALPSPPEVLRAAMGRTLQWAARCQAAATRRDQVLFGIVQGGLDTAMRLECAEQLAAMDFAGYAVGGLSVGEPAGDMLRVLEDTVPALPTDRPRYLMGVGRPQDLLEAIGRGIDLFDCVMPTRNGRNGLAFTATGPLRLRNRQFERDDRPVETGCPCPACRHSRSYLRHLFMSREMLGPVLLSAHNLTHYQRLLRDAREAIRKNRFAAFRDDRLASYRSGGIEDHHAADLSAGPAPSNT